MADVLTSIGEAVYSAVVSVWHTLMGALPSIVAAVLFIILGYVIGWVAKKVFIRFLKAAGVDDWMKEQNLVGAIANKSISEVAGSIVKWYIFFVFLKQAVELVKLQTLTEVLGFWIQYALLVIAAIVVILAGLIIGRYARNALESTKHSMRRLAGLIIELTIVYIAVVMGIRIIGLPTGMLESAFLIALAGFVIAISIAIGISFGFALKDDAKTIVKEFKKKQ